MPLTDDPSISIDAQSFLEMSVDGALFSEDRVYRYLLRREIWPQRTTCLFIMLNPSTADESKNDPTITRCINFARHWGFGRLEVVNLFAYRATDPKELYSIERASAIGPDNPYHIKAAILEADRVVCAWGNHGLLHDRGLRIRDVIIESGKFPLAFKITKKGQPIHPLYQKANADLIAWTS